MERVVREAGVNIQGTLLSKSVQLVAFADDIDIMGRGAREVKEAFVALEKSASRAGLVISEEKTKYMVVTRGSRRIRQNITLGNYNLEVVDSFVYLGTRVNVRNDAMEDLEARILAGNRAYYSLSSFLNSKLISKSTKLKAYTTLIRPAVLYGSETWALTTAAENKLNCFERRILRRICGPHREEGGYYRRRMNHELQQMFGKPSIVNIYKANRMRWVGHLERMNDSRAAKTIYQGSMEGKRLPGRPKGRWKDAVVGDLRKVKADIRDAQNRGKWRNICLAVQSLN